MASAWLPRVAGFGVPSDVFARYHRLKGSDVLMVSGTDDHGTPITYGADREGISPRQFSDRWNKVIVEDLKNLGLSYDCFTRTVTRNHHRVVQDLFLKLYERGYLIKKTQLGAFSPIVSAYDSPPIITSGGGGQTASYTVAETSPDIASSKTPARARRGSQPCPVRRCR